MEAALAYCTQSDIEARFGANNVAKWSQVDQDSTSTNTARIAAAIAEADALIDSRLRGSRYALPLSGPDLAYVVKSWSVRIAAAWLYDSRGLTDTVDGITEGGEGGSMSGHRRAALAEISNVRKGVAVLDLTVSTTPVAAAPFVV